MPKQTPVRASTQDLTDGTPVAVAANEISVTDALQVMVPEGNKSTYQVASRTGIIAADTETDLSTGGFAGIDGLNLFTLGNALNCAVNGYCHLASKTLVGYLALYDSTNVCLGLSDQVSIVSSATLKLFTAGNYACNTSIVDVRDATKARFYVSSITTGGGTWGVNCRPI